ncbi:MAG: tetratricopeptide repeat protein [bacterium]
MYQKLKTLIYFLNIVLILIFTQLYFNSCGGPATKKDLTPEQKKAKQDSIFKEHKQKVDRYMSFGWEPFKQKNYEKAKKYFSKIAKIDTTGIYGAILYQNLGTCYLQLNQPDSAIWAYKKGIENVPDAPYNYSALGYIYRRQGKDQKAIEMYEKLTELQPDSAEHFHQLGKLYANDYQNQKAIQAYQQAVALEPNNTEYQEILSNLLSASGDTEQIIKQKRQMVKLNPENMRYRFQLAKSYHSAAKFDSAIVNFKIVLKNQPDNIEALELLADSYRNTDKFTQAINIYKIIIEEKPTDKKNLCNLASAYTSLGRYTTARRTVNKALRIDNQYGLAYLTLGKIYETAADRNIKNNDGKTTYDDKLVYKIAYDQYVKAKNDLAYKREAENRIKSLEPVIPTTEDKFIHDYNTPKNEVYNWI